MSEPDDDFAEMAARRREENRRSLERTRRRAYWTGWVDVAAALFLGVILVSANNAGEETFTRVLDYFGIFLVVLIAMAGGWIIERYRR